jgi:hypothetical protein
VGRGIHFTGDRKRLLLLEPLHRLARAGTEELPGQFRSRHTDTGSRQRIVELRDIVPE